MYIVNHYVPYEGSEVVCTGTLEEVKDWFRKGLPVNQNHIYGGPWQGYCLDHLEVVEEGPSIYSIIQELKGY
jgi:hypothetical protein